MNTILTDDEMPPIPKDMGRMDFDLQTLINYGRAVEAAVLAKLREQEPIAWWVTLPSGEIDWSDEPIQHKEERPLDTLVPGCGYQPLYAAPLPAVVQVPQEFDYKHPRAQALIGADARHRIIIDLVWQILEDPRREFTASDMEYWDKLHDKVQQVALAASEAQAIPAPWREAVKRLRKNDAAGDTVFRCGFNAGIDAALAQLDALEGGE